MTTFVMCLDVLDLKKQHVIRPGRVLDLNSKDVQSKTVTNIIQQQKYHPTMQ